MFIKTCKYCGNKFETKRYPTVFCSQSCYFKYKRAKANENRLKLIEAYDKSLGAFLKDGYIYFKKKCAHCGNEFYANKSTGKYCCQKCHDEASWERRSKRRKAPSSSRMKGVALKMVKTCEMCGKSFVSQKITTRFCSSACARKFMNTSGYDQTEKMQKQKTPLERKDLMRISEAAEYLSISRTTLYRALWDGAFEVSEVHGVYLIRKSSIDEYLASNSTIFKRQVEKDGLDNPEVKIYANPIATTPSEYITLTEAFTLYGDELPSLRFMLRRSGLPFERLRNIRFYKKVDVENFVKKKVKSNHPEITEWYTVEDIMKIYNLERKSVYNLTFSNKIPKKKEYRTAFYSRKHVDEIFSNRQDLEENYYPAQIASDLSGLELNRLYKTVKKFQIPSINIGGRLWIAKKPFDELVRVNRL